MVETATELVRRRQGRQQRKRTKLTSPTAISSNQQARVSAEENIDDAIARLEAELANDDGDSDDSSSVTSEPSNSDVEHTKTDQVGSGKLPEPTKGMVCLSALKDDRIESLPSQFLPAVPKKGCSKKGAPAPNRKRTKQQQQQGQRCGLAKAVQEVLGGYVARSSEKLPFYCRVCQKQYSNENEFFEHRTSEFHKTASEAERKASYCKLCRKQLTSPAQMNEHLASMPHKERLRRVSSSSSKTGRKGQGHGQGSRPTAHAKQWK